MKRLLLAAAIFSFAGLIFRADAVLAQSDASLLPQYFNNRSAAGQNRFWPAGGVSFAFSGDLSGLAQEAQSLRLLPGDAAIAPAAGDQTAPAIARGNNTLLAVWSDKRANVTGGFEGETSRDISGVRLDANGNFLDAIPIAITAARATQDNPKVVWIGWDGANFIVTYQDQKNRLAEQTLDQLDARSDLFAMRVTPAGSILDPQGFIFSALPTGETDPAVTALNRLTMLFGSVVLNDTDSANYRIGYQRLDGSENKWPVAVAVATPPGGDVPLTVNFSSAGSGDPDGTIAGYFWDFGDGSTSNEANPSHIYSIPGPFVATLNVTDNAGAKTAQTVLVKAVAQNQPPVAVATAVPVSGPPPLNVIFYADGSYDPDGFLGNLQWNFSDGGTYYGSPAYHTFSAIGTYAATLTVYDSRGATRTTSINVYAGTTPTPTPTPTPSPVPEFDLMVSQSDAPDPVANGQPVTYTLTVSIVPTALGGSARPQVAFNFPSGVPVIFNSAGGTNGYTATLGSNSLLFTGGTISTSGTNAGTATLTVVLTPQSAGTLTSPGANVVVDPNNLINESNEANNTAATVTTTVTAASKPLFDFDGDRKSDISVFRPSNGTWYCQQSQAGFMAMLFGVSTDKITPADFDGDGKTDFAVYRPSNGTWYVLRSSNLTFFSVPFGNSTDKPVPADFDGDGLADIAVFRPSEGNWYVNKTSGGVQITRWGTAGDVPVNADYDGDGKSDLAIFRPSNGQWWLNRSTAGITVITFGISTDKPVAADYTGDGKTDIAVWRPSSGVWFVLRSEDSSFYSVPFGISSDIPVPADYDGDDKADVAIFRPDSANWFIQRSTAGILIQQFGTNGDLPTAAAYVP